MPRSTPSPEHRTAPRRTAPLGLARLHPLLTDTSLPHLRYLLDQTEELDNAEDFEDLPYACRAGSCSACAGKVISGTVDVTDCSFLSDDQKADGWVLTCTTKATSDVIIQTHMEDDMY